MAYSLLSVSFLTSTGSHESQTFQTMGAARRFAESVAKYAMDVQIWYGRPGEGWIAPGRIYPS